MPALATLLALCAGFFALLQPAEIQPSSVFSQPRLQAEYAAKQAAIQKAFAEHRYSDAERECREAVQLLPQVPAGYYNLACAQARQGKRTESLQSLSQAVELGFAQSILRQDPDFEVLREDPKFAQLCDAASKNAATPRRVTRTVEPQPVQDGVAWVRESNTAYDPRSGLFHVFFKPTDSNSAANGSAPTPPSTRPVIEGHGHVGELIRRWFAEGTAAGNTNDFYDNHDGDHSSLRAMDFPQLAFIEFPPEAARERLHVGLQHRFFYNQLTLGNSSMAAVGSPLWRSMARLGYTDPRLLSILYAQYTNNHIYVYPEHQDHDPGHNGSGGFGDVFCTNTPFVVISQGSSGSDRPFLEALACTLAALRPEVKGLLTQQKAIAPTLQMVMRFCQRSLQSPEEYLSGKAHPTVFTAESLDLQKMVEMAHALQFNELPPQVRLRVLEEDEGVVGRDYFETGPRERLFDSPSVIARLACDTRYSRRMVVSAEDSRDSQGNPLTWHWSVLRGDAQQIQLRPLNPRKTVVELSVPYHTRRPTAEGSPLESNRVDIGVFVHNGKYYSAPAFITFYFLDDESRVYAEGRIQSVDYKAAVDGGNYVDPVIHTQRTWRDEYHYDKAGHLTGWTRRRGAAAEGLTSDGSLVTERDQQGRAITARSLVYRAKTKNSVSYLEQQPGEELLHYTYESSDDHVGRIARREPATAKP